MWIRSQNKIRLLKVNYCTVDGTDIEGVFGDYNSATLGRYSTKEKAMKVLDMIEDHLNSRMKIIEKSVNDYVVSDVKSNVFQMPEDENV